ncbi:MAG: M24 family metallopeptidase, partial [Dehalococcoidia bacterium]
MTEFGFMGVDWEERINFDRLRRERLQRAQEALANSDADVLFIFRPEDVRYITGFRSHLGPATILHTCTCVLPKGGDPLLFTLDQEHAKARMPWMPKGTILPPAKIRTRLGIQEWVEQLRSILGSKLDGKVGIDIWSHPMMTGLQEFLPNTEFVDGYKTLMEAKIIKTRDELECQRAAALITEAGFEAALALLKPGVKECEVLAAAWQKFTELGSEWTQCSNIVTSGPYTAPYRRFTS